MKKWSDSELVPMTHYINWRLVDGVMEISCEVCGSNVAIDNLPGWVSWWLNRETRVVEAFHVTCCGPDRRCLSALDAKQRGLFQMDNHLDCFTGISSTKRLGELMADYEWTKGAREKACEYLVLFSVLPSATKDRLETFDELCGGLPLAGFAHTKRPPMRGRQGMH